MEQQPTRMRKVWIMKHSGDMRNLKMEEQVYDQVLGQGQVRIQVKAIGLNFADVFMCHGLYEAAPKTDLIPGYEFSGTIIEKGASPDSDDSDPFSHFSEGDAIMGVTKFNAYVSEIIVDYRYIRKIPSGWTFQQAAALTVQGLTAMYGLQTLGALPLKASAKCVLLHSMAGGVGLIALSILRQRGCKFVGTVGSESKKEFLVSLGVPKECVIVRSSGKVFRKQLQDSLAFLNEDGFDLIFDSLLGDFHEPGTSLLRPQGRCIVLGSGSLTTHSSAPNWFQLGWRFLWRPQVDPLKLMERNISIMGFNLVWLFDLIEELGALWDQLIDSVSEPPFIGEVFTFSEVVEALSLLQSGKTRGKVIISMEEDME